MKTMKNKNLTEDLNQRYSYCPETGFFTKLQGRGKHKDSVAKPCPSSLGYVVLSITDGYILAHRAAWFLTYGYFPKVIDHINGVRSDNRICNLRDVSQSINLQNIRGARRDSKTGLLGASYIKSTGKYRAQIYIRKGQNKNLGNFNSAEEAHEAYIAAKRHFHEGCTI